MYADAGGRIGPQKAEYQPDVRTGVSVERLILCIKNENGWEAVFFVGAYRRPVWEWKTIASETNIIRGKIDNIWEEQAQKKKKYKVLMKFWFRIVKNRILYINLCKTD